jgi:SAM-dependent methyltransferase
MARLFEKGPRRRLRVRHLRREHEEVDMIGNARRPFYAEYAWAFDLLIDRPVRKECASIVAWLIGRGARLGAGVLDAGCGTGRYAIELARRGYVVNDRPLDGGAPHLPYRHDGLRASGQLRVWC